MRKLLIGLVIILVVLVVVVVIAVANVNTYLDENREMLAGLASDAAGREVAYERAEVAFSSGLAVRIVGLRVADDPAFGVQDFLALDEGYVGVKLLPALSRRIEVSGIRLDAPTIRVIQTGAGFNFSTLGADGDAAEGEAPAQVPESPTDPGESAPLAVAIAALEISNGTISFEDRRSAEGLSLLIDEFETSGTDLALDGPIAIDFEARVQSRKKADQGLVSRLAGRVAIAGIEEIVGTAHLESPVFHPAIFGVRLEEGDVVERIDDLKVDVELLPNPVKSGYPVALRSAAARLAGIDLDDISIDVVYRDAGPAPAVRLEPVNIGIAQGDIKIDGDVVLGEPGQSPFELAIKISELESGILATRFADVPAGSLTGLLGGDINLTGDSLEWESLKKSLAGRIDLDVGDGALENVNLLNTLVDRLVSDPGLGALAANSIRDVAPDVLRGDRTPFSGVDMALEIANGAVQAKNLSMEAGDFDLRANGQVSLEGAVAAKGKIRFSQDLSGKILEKADRLGPVFADNGVVEVPVRIGGTTSSPSLMPDLSGLTAKATEAAKKEITDRAAKEISKRLFGQDKEGDSDSEKDSARDALKKGLGGLLGR